MEHLKNKPLIGLFLAIFIGVSFFFRENILRLFDFSQLRDQPEEISEVPPPTSLPVEEEPKEEGVKPQPSDKTVPRPLFTSSGAPLPPYKGRDPGELRPVPDEVKLFTEEQKKQIYDSIGTEARAVKLDPIHFTGWIRLGLLKKTIGDFEGARDAWEYAGLIEPFNSLSFSNLGELYWRYIGDYPKSELNLRASIKNKPDDIQNYVSLAELYHYSFKEKYDLADDVLLEGFEANPGNGTLMRRLAYLYEQRKEWDKALEWWNKVLVSSPDDQEVKDSIKKIEEKLEGLKN